MTVNKYKKTKEIELLQDNFTVLSANNLTRDYTP